MALRAHLLDLTFDVADSPADAPALDLDLLLAETTARPHSPPPSTDLAVVGVGADESGQQMVESGRFDLETALMGTRMLGEDLEDDLRPVEHARLDLQLEVALLARAQILVADHEVERALELHVAQRFDLAHADEMCRIDRGSFLYVRADDLHTRGASQVGQLAHLLGYCLWRRPGKKDPDQVRPLPRGFRSDQSASFPSFLIRAIASSRRASGAVTESRK